MKSDRVRQNPLSVSLCEMFYVTESLDEALYIIIDENANTEEILAKAELNAEIKSCLSELSKDESNLIILKYVKEFSNEEIAKILDVSQDVVRQRLSRVRRKLAALILKDREEV